MSINPTALWLDSTGRLQRELDAVSRELSTQRVKVDGLNQQLRDWQQKLAAGPSKRWFSDDPSPMELKLEIKQVELKLEKEQRLLNDLEAGYQKLTTDIFPHNKTWTFDEADHFVFDVLQTIKSEAKRGAYLEPDAGQGAITIPNWNPDSRGSLEFDPKEMSSALKGFGELLGRGLTKLFDSKRTKLSGIKMFRLILYLNRLYAERRSLLATYVQQLTLWDNTRLNTELVRRQQELNEADVKLSPLEGMAVSEITIQNPFIEQRRFLQQLIGEIDGALKRAQLPAASPPDPAAVKIAKIAELHRKMQDALNSNPPELHADIQRVYGQLIQAERVKP